jgi:hypothetical protein
MHGFNAKIAFDPSTKSKVPDVIQGDHIIEHAKTETLLRLEQPVQVAAPIAPKL